MPTTKPQADQARGRPGKVYVEVYNNSGVTGLAGEVAASATQAGWQVVGSDNWYGTIPASTVYYPPKLARAAASRWPSTSASVVRRPPSTRCGSTGSRSSSPPTTPDGLPRARSGSAVTGWTRGVHLRRGRAAVRRPGRAAADVVVGLDFDGTLAPIVDDPESAHIHPDAAQVLIDLAGAGARGRGGHRPARPPGAGPRRARRGRRRHRRTPARSSTCSASTATSAGPRPTAG